MMTREKSLWPNKQKTPNQKMEEEHEGSAREGIDSVVPTLPWPGWEGTPLIWSKPSEQV